MKVGAVGAVAALAAAAAAGHAWSYGFVADDAFISLRYARNLATGAGLVFNPGERVEGYSNPLWTLLLSLPHLLGLDAVLAARVLGASATGAAAALAAQLAARGTQGGAARWAAAASAGGVVAASAPIAAWGAAGLETSLFALLALAALGARRAWLAGLLAGLAAVTRPEGIALVLAAAVGRRRDADLRGGGAARALLVGAAVTGAWVALRRVYYGAWLPNTFHAKVDAFSGPLAARGLDYFELFARQNGGLLLYAAPLLLAPWRSDGLWWRALAVFAALGAAVVAVGGDGLPMFRFAAPLVAVWAVLAGCAVGALARLRPAPVAVASTALGPLALVALVLPGPPPDSAARVLLALHRDFEVPAWRAAGRHLARVASPGASVACAPIGAVGYDSGLVVVDMLGLVDEHVGRADARTGAGWAGHEKRDGAYVLSREPTYLLLGNVRVLDVPLPLDHAEFVRVRNPYVEAREGDVYTPALARDYVPDVARLDDVEGYERPLYLHFLRRREP